MPGNTHTNTKLALQYVIHCLSWLSVFSESLLEDWQAHRGPYTMLMSQSGLNTQKPMNATVTFNPFHTGSLS